MMDVNIQYLIRDALMVIIVSLFLFLFICPPSLPLLHGSQRHPFSLLLDVFNKRRPAACLGLCIFQRNFCGTLWRLWLRRGGAAFLWLHWKRLWGLCHFLLLLGCRWWWNQGCGRSLSVGSICTFVLALVVRLHVFQHHVWFEFGWCCERAISMRTVWLVKLGDFILTSIILL